MSEAYVSQAKREQLQRFMDRLAVRENDLTEKFILGSGSGGQKINKTASCVYLKHGPSGIEIKCQRSRSRELNRYYARKELCEQLEERKLGWRASGSRPLRKSGARSAAAPGVRKNACWRQSTVSPRRR